MPNLKKGNANSKIIHGNAPDVAKVLPKPHGACHSGMPRIHVRTRRRTEWNHPKTDTRILYNQRHLTSLVELPEKLERKNRADDSEVKKIQVMIH